MYLYYKIRNEKFAYVTTIIILLIGVLMGGYFLFETYKEIATMPNGVELIQGKINFDGQNKMLTEDKVLQYISVNSGLILQFFLLLLQLYAARHLWRRLKQEQLQYFLKDFRYFYYSVLGYVCSFFVIFFVIDSILILLVAPILFQYFVFPFVAISLLLLSIILMELLLVNFYQVITQLKLMMIAIIIMPGIFVAFIMVQTTIAINLCMIIYLAILTVILHLILMRKIRRNKYVEDK